MAATLDRAALLAAATDARAQNPAWVATGGLSGAADATETTFVRPVVRGAVWVHENDGTARLVAMDPYDVVVQLQRAANVVLRERRERTIREDGIYGPETRRGLEALVASRVFGGSALPSNALPIALLEWALLAAYHGGAGQVVIPRRAEIPTFGAAQRLDPSPTGHTDAVVLIDRGTRVLPTPAAPPRPADATPPAPVPIPPTPEVPALPTPPLALPPATASALGVGRTAVIAGGFAALGYVVFVAARELRAKPSRRVKRRLSVPHRNRRAIPPPPPR